MKAISTVLLAVLCVYLFSALMVALRWSFGWALPRVLVLLLFSIFAAAMEHG